MLTLAKNITLILGLSATSFLWADTYEYQALTDFSDIEAGEVPYYRHVGANALAINAAIEHYRDKFARATLVFDQSAGLYDVTITSLGETDGDGIFQFLVAGEVVGSAINEPATADYGLQYHTFENISIPAGALIGVESSAVSNGLIPEGEAFAFARGRWVTLTISSVDTDSPTLDPEQKIDLSLSLSGANQPLNTGDIATYSIEVENTSDEFTATNPEITIDLPQGYSAPTSDQCSLSDTNTLTCKLPELAPNDTSAVTFSTAFDIAGDHEVTASIQADQDDSDNTNNNETVTTSVTPTVGTTTLNNTVDLTVSLSADKDSIEVGDTITYTVVLANNHQTNTAADPIAGILLPNSLRFLESDVCTPTNDSVICHSEALAPISKTQLVFTAEALESDSNANLFVAASSSQPDAFVANNDAQLVSVINPVAPQTSTPEDTTPTAITPVEIITTDVSTATNPTDAEQNNKEENSTSSGGGSWSFLALPILALVTVWRRRSRTFL